MPILSDDRSLTRFILDGYPADDHAWVEFHAEALTGDVEAAFEAGSKNELTQILSLIAALVKNWNFTDPSGKVLPITVETLRRMKPGDIKQIREAIERTIDAPPISPQKKTS